MSLVLFEKFIYFYFSCDIFQTHLCRYKAEHVKSFVLDCEIVAFDKQADKILPFQVETLQYESKDFDMFDFIIFSK